MIGAEETVRVRYRHRRARGRVRAPRRPAAAGRRLARRSTAGSRARQASVEREARGARAAAAAIRSRARRALLGRRRAAGGRCRAGAASRCTGPRSSPSKTSRGDGRRRTLEPRRYWRSPRCLRTRRCCGCRVGEIERSSRGGPVDRATRRVERDFPSTLRIAVVERRPGGGRRCGRGRVCGSSRRDGHWLGKRPPRTTPNCRDRATSSRSSRRGGRSGRAPR